MTKTHVAAAAALGVAIGVSCATSKPVEATSEVIYEDSDGGETTELPPMDPWEGCQAQSNQPGVVTFTCGEAINGAFIRALQSFTPEQVDAQLTQLEGRFPEQSTRERITPTYGEIQGSGSRVYEASPVAPFRWEMVFLPTRPDVTLVLSCMQRGSATGARCAQLMEQMATQQEVPEKVPGSRPPPAEDMDGGMMGDGGMMMEGDGGLMGDEMGMDAGRTRDAGAPDAGTRRRRSR